MKGPSRFTFLPAIPLVCLILCYSLIATTLLPLVSVVAKGTNHLRSHLTVPSYHAGVLGIPQRFLASVFSPLQGGGPPNVPGPNLPDLDQSRNISFVEPVAPSPISSTQACSTCTRCTGSCDPSSNHAPVAFNNGPYYGRPYQSLGLDASGSFDPDGGLITYQWNFGDGTNSTGMTTQHTYTSVGTYQVTLTVTDSENPAQSRVATTTATITNVPTPTPTPTPGNNQGNSAEFVMQSVTTSMLVGQAYNVSVTMRNTGTSTWTAARLYRLGSQNPEDNGNWGVGRVALPNDVAPGSEVTFNFSVRPSAPGGVNFQWRMVQDGVEWFGTHTTNVVVNVSGAGGQGAFVPDNVSMARLEPGNRTGTGGDDLLSRNFNWAVSLVNLSGRAGLDLGLSLAYNSLVWTKVPGQYNSQTKTTDPATIIYDADQGFPTAGFRLGFPVLQGKFYDNQAKLYAYMLIMPSGKRIELRENATGGYESVDSSNLQMLVGGSGQFLVRAPDGTVLTYVTVGDAYRCTSVKDRNGNYLSVTYTNKGRLTSVVDTLGRTINFNYDTNQRLQSLSQMRGGIAHLWATFGYGTVSMNPNFNESGGGAPITVVGPNNFQMITVLTQVGLDDGSRHTFDYTPWGQVRAIRRYAADGHQLSYTTYNVPSSSFIWQSDCPRFTERRDWAENWNAGAEAVTKYFSGTDANGAWVGASQPDAPNSIVHKEYYTTSTSDWKRGLVLRSEAYDPANVTTPQKVTTVAWTQDNPAVAYPVNPRPTQVTISDANENRRMTTIEYASFGLPFDVFEWGPYGSTGWTLLRRTHTDYDLSPVYLNKRIIGLVKAHYLFGPNSAPPTITAQVLFNKSTYDYDAGGEFLQNQGTPVQFDGGNYSTNFVQGRGNLTSTRRWDVNNETSIAHSTASIVGYNNTGLPVLTRDPLGHQTTISYVDAFSADGTASTNLSYTTMAYPTTVTDPGGISAISKYHYDLGAVTRVQDPKGAALITQYDAAGRVKQSINAVNLAHTRFVYPASHTIANKFTTINDLDHEVYSATVFDGAGRVRAVASDFPDETSHYSGQYSSYDVRGRAVLQSNPIEITGVWTATGLDTVAQGGFGWIFTTQTYDWQGRPLVTTNTDGTTKEASYAGCGCAGGEVATLTDEGTMEAGVPKRRQQKTYSDVLGRTVKSEMLNWQAGSVYSTTVNSYNARDQVTLVRHYAGGEGSGTFQDTTATYDGYGRLKTRHIPQQDENKSTSYTYYANDRVESVTDARGAGKNYLYDNRGLLGNITYSAPAGIPVAPSVTFSYDAAGNRLSMVDGPGRIDYGYDQLSRLTSETRRFTDYLPQSPLPNNSYKLQYTYNISGQLKTLTDPSGRTIYYNFDSIGRLTNVTGTAYAGITDYASMAQYRAWGELKHLRYGDSSEMNVTFNRRQQPDHFTLGGAQQSMQKHYEYYADGTMRYVQDQLDQKFDRSYEYDQVGRVSEAKSGAEARGQSESNLQNLPYRYSYRYDAFGNFLGRIGTWWIEATQNTLMSFVNNRTVGVFDADGRETESGIQSFYSNSLYRDVTQYNASGRPASIEQFETFYSETDPEQEWQTGRLDSMHDGNGLEIKSVNTSYQRELPPSTLTSYKIRSTVLQGRTIMETNSFLQGGTDGSGYVYAGGRLLAIKGKGALCGQTGGCVQGPKVYWQSEDPGETTSLRRGSSDSFDNQRMELDPLGSNVGFHYSVVLPPPPPEPFKWYQAGGFGFAQPDPEEAFTLSDGRQVQCYVDGNLTSCASAFNVLRIGGGHVDTRFTQTSTLAMLGLHPLPSGQAPTTETTPNTASTETPSDACVNGNCPESNGTPLVIVFFEGSLIEVEVNGNWELTAQPTEQVQQDTGAGGGASGELNTGRKAEFKYGKFLSCLKEFFPDLKTFDDGRSRSFSFDRSFGGSFVGAKAGRLIISRTETNAFTSTTLGQMLQTIGVGSGGRNSGATFNNYPQRNYVASDVASDTSYTDIGVFGAFIHELANSVGEQYGLADAFSGYAKRNARRGISDPDVGAAFETCVFGGLVGLQSGRVGTSRELR